MLCLSGFELYSRWVPLSLCFRGLLLCRRENHTGQGFCSHIREMISARFRSVADRSWAAPISKVERHVSDRFCATLWCSVNTYSDRRKSE